jgi:hypothetical protein
MEIKMTKYYTFGDQTFTTGSTGETIFHQCYFDEVHKGDSKQYDFIMTSTGEKIEVKTETRSIQHFQSFFIEWYSDLKRQWLGGPFRSTQCNVEYFVIFSKADGEFYWFKSSELAEFLILNIETFQKKNVNNNNRRGQTWTTRGLIVPVASIQHLCIQKDTIEDAA